MAPPDIMAKVARRQHDALILLRQTHGIVCTVIVGVCIALAWFDVVPGLDTFVFLPRAVPGGTGPSWASTLYEHHPDDMYFIGFWAIGLTALRVIVMRGPLEVIGACGVPVSG